MNPNTHHLINILTTKSDKISAWLSHYQGTLTDPIYASVDVRNAGFKIAPIDTNIFPAGWNNLCPAYQRAAAKEFKTALIAQYPNAKKILIIPERHTRNTYYLANLLQLTRIIERAEYEVQIGTIDPAVTGARITLETADGTPVIENKIARTGNRLRTETFEPDICLLNNDFADGIPDLLKDIEQPLIPSPLAGWHSRRKSDHFRYYNMLCGMFAHEFDIDPWLMRTYIDHRDEIDFETQTNIDTLAEAVDEILAKIRKKYDEYNIATTPFVFVKNESGTYGLGIMTAESGNDIRHLNLDARKTMRSAKGAKKVTRVIIQEGIPTVDRLNDIPAEPVHYVVNNRVIGGFFRLHKAKTDRENLNTPGMQFTKMCLHNLEHYRNTYDENLTVEQLMPLYELTATIASIATGYELIGLTETKVTETKHE